MISLAGHTFDPHKACFVCQHVFDGAPVLAFAHDEDGDLQVACGAESHTGEDWRVVGVAHLACDDLQLASPPTVNMGYEAEREAPRSEWVLFSLS